MKHLGGVGIVWFMLSGYSGPYGRWCNLEIMWGPVSALVVCHSGLERFPCLPSLVYFQCSLMALWALP